MNTNVTDLLSALGHAAVYAAVAGALLIVALLVLDVLTPGHLGTHLHGSSREERSHDPETFGYLNTITTEASRSAGIVVSAWLIGNAAILFTAIWTNGETSLGWALAWTVAFGVGGIILNTLMVLAMDAVTPGNLREIVCTPGTAVPLAYMTAAGVLAVSAIVCASIA